MSHAPLLLNEADLQPVVNIIFNNIQVSDVLNHIFLRRR